jgi:hypothetical protein
LAGARLKGTAYYLSFSAAQDFFTFKGLVPDGKAEKKGKAKKSKGSKKKKK